jgi:hypothetical protein
MKFLFLVVLISFWRFLYNIVKSSDFQVGYRYNLKTEPNVKAEIMSIGKNSYVCQMDLDGRKSERTIPKEVFEDKYERVK